MPAHEKKIKNFMERNKTIQAFDEFMQSADRNPQLTVGVQSQTSASDTNNGPAARTDEC